MKIPKTPIPCSIDVTPFTFNVTGYAQEYRRATGVSSTARVDTNYADCDCGSQVASRDERVRSCVRACVRATDGSTGPTPFFIHFAHCFKQSVCENVLFYPLFCKKNGGNISAGEGMMCLVCCLRFIVCARALPSIDSQSAHSWSHYYKSWRERRSFIASVGPRAESAAHA